VSTTVLLTGSLIVFAGNSAVAQLPIKELIAESKTLLSKTESAVKRISPPMGDQAKLNRNYISCLLKAGKCDQAFELMKQYDAHSRLGTSFVEHYCFMMAIAGRAAEIPAQVDCFRNSPSVKSRLRDEECDFEHLCKRPTLHGTAISLVLQGETSPAIDRLKALQELEQFSGEHSDVISATAFEVFHVLGAQKCIEFLESLSGKNERKFRSLLRSTVIHLSRKNQENPLLFALLPDHVEAFEHEFWLATREPREDYDAQSLVAHGIESLPKVLTNGVECELAAQIVSSEITTGSQKDDLITRCLECIEKLSDKEARDTVYGLIKPLIATGDVDGFEKLSGRYRSSDKRAYTICVRKGLEEAGDRQDQTSIARLVKLLPNPADMPSEDPIKSSLVNVLLKLMQLEAAERWVETIKKAKVRAPLQTKLEFKKLIANLNGQKPDRIAEAIGEFISAKDNSHFSDLNFRRNLLATVGAQHGAAATWETAKRLPKSMLSNTSPLNECVAALIGSKEFDMALEVAGLASDKEISTEKLSARTPNVIPFSQLEPAFVDKLEEKFPASVFALRQKCRNAIKNGDRKKAVKLLKKLISRFDDNILQWQFTDVGWSDTYLKTIIGVAGSDSQGERIVRESVYDVADYTVGKFGVSKAIPYVEKYLATQSQRIWVYFQLVPTVSNPSTYAWIP